MTTTLSRPNLIARVFTLAAGALSVVVLLSVLSGGNPYVLNLDMSNASGLRPGSQVLLGGVPVGTVDSLNLNRSNVVIADLHLNRDQVHIGRGASASIVAANLLGEEYVALSPGARDQPLPSGTTLPESATTLPTELDQIVDVLDGATRARLAVLLQEAGVAVGGRQSDISAILRQFPLSLSAATQLLTTMVSDNHTLADLVSRGDQFLVRMNAYGGPLRRVIGAAAGASVTLADRAAALRQTVIGAPATLATIQTFVHNLGNTAASLTDPVGEIAGDAAPLDRLLAAVKPFTRAAVPTLNRASAVAPELTALANRATPTVKAAIPTVASLERIATLAAPLSGWVGLSAQDIVGIFNGWSRAVQFRDGISHVFAANLYLDSSIVLNLADQGSSPLKQCENLLDVRQAGLLRAIAQLAAAGVDRSTGCSQLSKSSPRVVRPPAKHQPTVPPGAVATHNPASPLLGAAGSTVGSVPGGVSKTLSGVSKAVGGVTSGVGKTLGGVTSGVAKTLAPSGATNQTGTTNNPSSLQHLLGYLLGK